MGRGANVSDQSHILEARGISFAYRGDTPVLSEVDMTATPGKFLGVLGPNGSGKTTLLRVLLGQLKPSDGSILLDSKQLRSYSTAQMARLLAYVPQFPRLAFAFTVRQIVLMGRFAHAGVLGLPGKQDLEVVREAMKMTDTLTFAARTLDELSGGEAQRVMIARALSQQPSVILLDEPTSHLDIKNQLVIYRMMQRLAHEWGMGVVCVSHDINLAARFCDELVLMRQGRVLAGGAPTEVIRQDVLASVYDVAVDLISAPDQTVPLVRVR